MPIDRSIPPPIKPISKVQLFSPEIYTLDNGLPVYEINMETQEVVKLELIFFAGRQAEKKQGVAKTTLALIKEGNEKRKFADIAEKIDYYGALLKFPFAMDTASIELQTLTKHLDQLLPLVQDVLTAPIFPEQEMEAYIRRSQQRLKVDLSKNDVVADRIITERIFGTSHPYGYNTQSETLEQLHQKDLQQHFDNNYHALNGMLIVSGKFNVNIRQLLNQYLGQLPVKAVNQVTIPAPKPARGKKKLIKTDDALQTAVRIGKRLFHRSHPDYAGMFVLTSLLGGYFSSRLVNNLREEKGYTYNVYASVDTLRYDGYFQISTETNKKFRRATVKEIYKEIELLQNELVTDSELQMLKNYLLGNLLTGLDGAFNTHEAIKTLLVEGVSLQHFEDFVKTIQQIQPAEIKALAQKHLQIETMHEVLVGT